MTNIFQHNAPPTKILVNLRTFITYECWQTVR